MADACKIETVILLVIMYSTDLIPKRLGDCYMQLPLKYVGRVAQSVQQLATGWTVWGSNSGGGEIFCTCPDRPWGPPSLLYNGYRVFPGGKEWPGRDADPLPPSSAVVMKELSCTSTPPMGCTACTRPQCLYRGALYLYLYPQNLPPACREMYFRDSGNKEPLYVLCGTVSSTMHILCPPLSLRFR